MCLKASSSPHFVSQYLLVHNLPSTHRHQHTTMRPMWRWPLQVSPSVTDADVDFSQGLPALPPCDAKIHDTCYGIVPIAPGFIFSHFWISDDFWCDTVSPLLRHWAEHRISTFNGAGGLEWNRNVMLDWEVWRLSNTQCATSSTSRMLSWCINI